MRVKHGEAPLRTRETWTHTPSLSARELPFCALYCGSFLEGPGYFTEREGLDNFLLLYTVGGKGLLTYRGKVYPLSPGDAFLIDCREYQLYRTAPGESWEFRWVHFDGKAASAYFSILSGDSYRILRAGDLSGLDAVFDRIASLMRENRLAADLELSLHLQTLLTRLALTLFDATPSGTDTRAGLARSAVRLIEERFRSRLTVDDMCRHLHVSKYYFIRLFGRQVGMSPHEYLVKLRISEARTLLAGTALTVSEIARQVGFENVNSFIRDFRLLVGTTPGRYRKLPIG